MAFLFDTTSKIKAHCDELHAVQSKKEEDNIKLTDLYNTIIEGPRRDYDMLYEQHVENSKDMNIHDRVILKYPELPKYYNIYTKEYIIKSKYATT